MINKTFEQLAQKMYPQSKLLSFWTLTGGVSAQVTALEIEQSDGQVKKVVVRRYGEVDLQQNPDVAADEFKLLNITHSQNLATPEPYYFDQSGDLFPTPFLVIEFIEGRTDFKPSDLNWTTRQLASHLAEIHNIDCTERDMSFLPQQADIYTAMFRKRPDELDESIGEGRIRQVMEAAWPLNQNNEPTILHGDFWPGNVLWKNEQIVAIIDWEDAQFGDPLADVANGRLEILWAYGKQAMVDFTQHYQSMTTLDYANLPYWDLCTALHYAFKIPGFVEDKATEEKLIEEHKWFVNQAYEVLGL